jgi:NAD(P)-dependent dehydrogenase (short-subunit alcohol dehydrogenase family)
MTNRSRRAPGILDLTTEDFDATMKTNIYAPFWIIKAALLTYDRVPAS